MRPRTGSHDGVVPCTVVVAVSLPAVSTSEDDVIPATALMSGASTGEASADTSAWVSVEAEPSASRTPEVEVVLPGVMVRTFEPSALISEVTWPEAPSPRPDGDDHAGNADQDAEDGQEGPQPVAPHPVDAGAEGLEPAHRTLSR